MDLLDPFRTREESPAKDEDNQGQDGSEEEEPEQRAISSTLCEEPARTQRSPDHAGVEVGVREGASEAVHCVFSAYSRDVIEGPVDHSYLS